MNRITCIQGDVTRQDTDAIPGNRTLLTGTTWYHQRLWANHIIHEIHMRLLGHIKAQAES